MLFCAGILGGYYSDWHDVDEDLVVVLAFGGDWGMYWTAPVNGCFYRNMCDSTNTLASIVASSNMKN